MSWKKYVTWFPMPPPWRCGDMCYVTGKRNDHPAKWDGNLSILYTQKYTGISKDQEIERTRLSAESHRMIIHSQDVEKAQALYRPDAGTSDGHSANDLLNMPSGCQSRHTFVSSPQRYGKRTVRRGTHGTIPQAWWVTLSVLCAEQRRTKSEYQSGGARDRLEEMNYLFREQGRVPGGALQKTRCRNPVANSANTRFFPERQVQKGFKVKAMPCLLHNFKYDCLISVKCDLWSFTYPPATQTVLSVTLASPVGKCYALRFFLEIDQHH